MKQSDIHVRRAPAEPLQERRREPGQDGLRCTDPEAACADLRIKGYRRGDHAANPGKEVRDGLTKLQGARRRNDAPGGPQEQRVVQQAAKPSQDWSLRVTEVYRRDAAGGNWCIGTPIRWFIASPSIKRPSLPRALRIRAWRTRVRRSRSASIISACGLWRDRPFLLRRGGGWRI